MQREGFRVTAEFEGNHWWFRSRRDLFLRQVERAAGEIEREDLELLDYGCGTGHNLHFLAHYGQARGADLQNPQAKGLRETSVEPLLDLTRDLSEYHGHFDIITALDVLEHFDDDVAGLRQIGRFLRPDGQVILTLPAYGWLWSGEDVISEHRRRYTRAMLERSCRAAGFRIHFLSYFNLSILPAMASVIWLRRLFGSDTARSNLSPTARPLNAMLYALTSLEARSIGSQRLRLPAGASLVCRCSASSG